MKRQILGIIIAITAFKASIYTLYAQEAVTDVMTHQMIANQTVQTTSNQVEQIKTAVDQLNKLQEQYNKMKEQLQELKNIYKTAQDTLKEATDIKTYIGDPKDLNFLDDNFINLDGFDKLKGIYDKSFNAVTSGSEDDIEISEEVKNVYGNFNYDNFQGSGGSDGNGGFNALKKQIILRDSTNQAATALMENNKKLLDQIEDLKTRMKSAKTETERQYLQGQVQLLQTNYQITKDNYELQRDAEAGNALAREASERSREKAQNMLEYQDAMKFLDDYTPADINKSTEKYILKSK